MQIIPAIIGPTFKEVREKINKVDDLVEWVQLDIMDGIFVAPYTWQNADDLNEISGKVKIEAHLMVSEPEVIISEWFATADRIIIHVEATDHIEEIKGKLAHRHNKFGLAINLETPIDVLDEYYSPENVIQLMGIAEIGYHGHPFEKKVLDKIRALRQKFPDATIQVDGGITLETGKQCLEAGANNLVVGSALWESEDIAETIREFQSLV